MGRLEGKVAIVTGAAASGGVGAACARRFAEEGARVVVADVVGDGAQDVADSIVAGGAEAIAVTVDVSDEEQVRAMVAAAVEQFGRIDILHNNAALQRPDHMARDGAVEDLDVDIWDRTFAVNLRGYMLGCKHVVPVMREQGEGSIINTSSRAGSAGELRTTAYGASKAGIDVLTQYVATQYGKQGIRCNALVIAGIMTDALLANTDEAFRARIIRHLLTTYLATPRDIANVALFLASDESRYVTGHLLAADGGWGAHSPRFADTLDASRG